MANAMKPTTISTSSQNTVLNLANKSRFAKMNASGLSTLAAGQPVEPMPVGILAPQPAQRQRRQRVHEHQRRGGQLDQAAPAGEGQEEEHAGHEGDDDGGERDAALADPAD